MAKNELLVSNVYMGGVKKGSASLNVIDTSQDLSLNFHFLMDAGPNSGNFYPQDDQFSPPYDRVVKARCYASTDVNLASWDFWFDQPGESTGISSMVVTGTDNTRAFFFDIRFASRNTSWRANFWARHKPSGTVKQVYSVRFLPTNLNFPIALTGLFQGRHDLMTSLKTAFPAIYTGWYTLSPVNVTVPRQLIMLGRAFNEGDHWADNTPIIITSAWDSEQKFNLNVAGCVIGYGGKGGNAGWTYVDGWVKYQFSTDGYSGGAPIHVDDSNNVSRSVNIYILPGGMWEAGGGGGPAGKHSDPGRFKPWSQYGMPGQGGMPNGMNGAKSPYQRRTWLSGKQTQLEDNRPRHPQPSPLDHLNLVRFYRGEVGFHETGSEDPAAYSYQFGGWGTYYTGFNEDGNSYAQQGFDYPAQTTPPGGSSGWGDKSQGGYMGNRVPPRCVMVQDASLQQRTRKVVFSYTDGALSEPIANTNPWITASLVFETT